MHGGILVSDNKERYNTMSISDYSLIDQALAALSSPVRGLINYENVPLRFNSGERPFDASKIEFTKLTRYSRERIQETYKDLRKAKRYVISNNLLDHLCEIYLSIQPPKLLELIADARPPHDLMWIEWDEDARQRLIFGYKGLSENQIEDGLDKRLCDYLGYFIESFSVENFHNPDTDHWIFTPVFPFGSRRDPNSDPLKSQKIMFNSTGFSLSTDPWTDQDIERSMQDFFQGDPPEGMSGIEQNFKFGFHAFNYDDSSYPVEIKNLCRHTSSVQTRAIDWHIPRTDWLDTRYSAKEHQNLRQSDLVVLGDLKFLICLLSVLNYDWVIKEKKPAEKQRRMRYGKQIRYDSHIVCEIDLPKKNGISISVHNQDPQGSKRLHDVRGHFRRLQSGKRTWVREHRRGNKNLGVITKDYVLTSKNKGEINANIL
jgi:hypothetical protein